MAEDGAITAEMSQNRARFRDVLRHRTFLVLYLAETQSIVGDQLARVALSILVFDRTDSAAATAATYAATFLPAILGGALFSGLGDRYHRRLVMVGCDVLRAALYAVTATPGMPLPVVVVAVALAALAQPVFTAAEVSAIAASMPEDRYRVANGMRQMSAQIAQVAGFAVGGAVVEALAPRAALALDAASFIVSAVVIRAGGLGALSAKPTAGLATRQISVRSVVRAVMGDDRLRSLFAYSWLAGFFVVPEGLAAPYARGIGAGEVGVGLLLAAIPFGSVLGAIWLVRVAPGGDRWRLVRWMALLTGVPLLFSAFEPASLWSIVLWAVSGFAAAYQVDVFTLVVGSTDDAVRGRTYGFLVAGLTGAQGLGIIVFGGVSQWIGPGRAIGLAGLAGVCGAALVALSVRNADERAGGAHSRIAPR